MGDLGAGAGKGGGGGGSVREAGGAMGKKQAAEEEMYFKYVSLCVLYFTTSIHALEKYIWSFVI